LDPPDSPEVARHKRAVVERARADAREDRALRAQAKAERAKWHEIEDGAELSDTVTVLTWHIKAGEKNTHFLQYLCFLQVQNLGDIRIVSARAFIDEADGSRRWSSESGLLSFRPGTLVTGFKVLIDMDVLADVQVRWSTITLGIEIRGM